MSTETGLNQTAASAALDLIISGGADVRLMNQDLAYNDGAAELDTKEVSAADYSAYNVAQADWDVTFDTTDNKATLENGIVVDFGETQNDWGTVVDIAIHDPSTDEFIIADEPNNPEITTGEEVSFPTGDITYTLGP
jgi:hypothetical protein